MSRGLGSIQQAILECIREHGSHCTPLCLDAHGTYYRLTDVYRVKQLCRFVARSCGGFAGTTATGSPALDPTFRTTFSRAIRSLIAQGYLRPTTGHEYCDGCDGDTPTVVVAHCLRCHRPRAQGGLKRIAYVTATDKCALTVSQHLPEKE
jgi:hypothetical protein